MRGVVDPATIRYLPWLDRTALVIVDLVDVDSGAPVEVSPRRILQRQADAAREAGYVAKCGSEIEFFLFKQAYDDAHADDYRTLTPNSPWVEDYNILQTTKEEDVIGAIRRGLAAAGLPVEFSKGEAGRGQHEINLTFQDAVEMADINMRVQERRQGDRRARTECRRRSWPSRTSTTPARASTSTPACGRRTGPRARCRVTASTT